MTDIDRIKAERKARRAAAQEVASADSVSSPKTEYVLVRTSRSIQPITVSIVRNDGSFDFTDYRFYRMSPANTMHAVEEWVFKDDLQWYVLTSQQSLNQSPQE